MIRIPRRTVKAVLAATLILGAAGIAWRLDLPQVFLGRGAPLRVVATGHNWWWEFRYPDLGLTTANEWHLPENRQVALEITSVDTAHTLAVPELGLLARVIPGATTKASFHAPSQRTLGGECSEICGTAHNMMRVRVVIQSEEDFQAWAETQKEPAAIPQTEQQWRGYEMLTTACAQCHSLNPAEQNAGLRGPNLAHLMSRSVFAGAAFDLNETNLRRWIRDTQAMKEGNDMVVNLPRDDYEAVVDYLLMLR